MVHNKVSGTSQIEVICAAASIDGRLIQLTKTSIGEVRSTAIILDPDIIESNLSIGVRQSGRNCLSNTEFIRPVGRRTMFDIGIHHGFFVGITAIGADTKTTATVDGGFQEWAMRATGRHDGGRNRQGVHNPAEILFVTCGVVAGTNESIGIVFAHQSVHVPVATADSPAVYTVIAGCGVVRVNLSFVIDVVRITGTAAVCIEPGTGIGIHGIMTDSKAITVTNKVLQCIISFAGYVRFTVVVRAEVNRILTVISLCIL